MKQKFVLDKVVLNIAKCYTKEETSKRKKKASNF